VAQALLPAPSEREAGWSLMPAAFPRNHENALSKSMPLKVPEHRPAAEIGNL